jgi:C4-dicarboxylate-specific signal transduction histidine kinase
LRARSPTHARSRIWQSYRRHLEERVAERTEELEKANTEKERLIAVLRERSQVLERKRRRTR